MNNTPAGVDPDDTALYLGGWCGGTGGNLQTVTSTSNYAVKKIVVGTKLNGGFLGSLSVTFTDGTIYPQRIGLGGEQFSTLDLTDVKLISGYMSLTKFQTYYLAGYLEFTYTTNGQDRVTWSVGKKVDGSANGHSFDCGSGVLLGFNVRSGSDIDALNPIFLRPFVFYSDAYNISSYQGDAKGLQQARFSLDGKVDTTYTYTYSTTRSVDVTVSKSSELTVGATFREGTSLTIEEGVSESVSPIYANASETVSFEAEQSLSATINDTESETNSFSETSEVTISLSFGTEAGEGVKSVVVQVFRFLIRATGYIARTVSIDEAKTVTFTYRLPFSCRSIDETNVVYKDNTIDTTDASAAIHPNAIDTTDASAATDTSDASAAIHHGWKPVTGRSSVIKATGLPASSTTAASKATIQ